MTPRKEPRKKPRKKEHLDIEKRIFCSEELEMPNEADRMSDEESGTLVYSTSSKTSAEGPEKWANIAPNLSLNFRDSVKYSTAVKEEKAMVNLFVAAIVGVVLQRVLAYFGVVTLHPALKDDSDGSFPTIASGLGFSGTVLLAVGIIMCVSVIDGNTEEKPFKLLDNSSFEVMWVRNRRGNTTEYNSFVIFADHPHSVLLRSRQKPESESQAKKWWTTIGVLAAAGITIVGFIMQLHNAAS